MKMLTLTLMILESSKSTLPALQVMRCFDDSWNAQGPKHAGQTVTRASEVPEGDEPFSVAT
jgi:hypothetical protein